MTTEYRFYTAVCLRLSISESSLPFFSFCLFFSVSVSFISPLFFLFLFSSFLSVLYVRSVANRKAVWYSCSVIDMSDVTERKDELSGERASERERFLWCSVEWIFKAVAHNPAFTLSLFLLLTTQDGWWICPAVIWSITFTHPEKDHSCPTQ